MVSKKGVNSKILTGLCLCLLLTLLSGTALVTAASFPVVLNPGFEAPGAGPPVFPNNWVFTTTLDPPDDFLWLYPTGFPHTGAESAGIMVNSPNGAEPGDHAEWSQLAVIPVYPSTTYNLSAWVFMTTPPNLFVDIGVIWEDSGGTPLGTAFTAPVNVPQAAWFELYHIATSPAGTAQVTIVLRATLIGGDAITWGDIFFDDVAFYPLGDSSLGGNTPGDHGNYFDPDADPYNEMLQVNVTATNEGLTQINFTLAAYGTADDSTDIAEVDLIYDQNANGLYDSGTESILDSGVYASDNGTLQLDSGHTVPQGQSHAFLIVYQLTFTATAGETFQFNVTQIRALGQTSGLTLNLPGPPYTSAVKTMVGSVVASVGDNSPGNHDWAPNGITPNVLLQLDLFAIGEDFTVEGITLSFTRGDTAHVIAVLIILDVDGNGEYDATDELVGTGLGQATQTITLDPTVLVSQGETEHFLIALTMATTAVEGATYSVDVTDVDVVGAIDSSTQVVSLPIRSSTKTIIAPPPLPFDPLLLILGIVILILVILVIVLLIRRRRSG
ncbi:MAG: hypothetical protein Q6364_05210 [Candidatus Hermodarchaeota archaeon]|nr:hypothetical protein [Candidatus Hermodarchaeota archaeon]